MDVTFVLSAIIFTLLAIVAATSWLSGSSPAAEFASARSYFGYGGDGAAAGPEPPGPRLNGHVPAPVPDKKKKKTASKKEEEEEEEEAAADDWCEISGSSHDHWDVVKSVLSEEAHPHLHTGELATPVEQCSSTSSLTASRPGSENTNLDVDTSSEASSGRGRRSYIGLSDTELLKCAFSYPQTEGATESPAMNDKVETNNSLKYVPGKARSHHLEMMMSKEELEEEQRVQSEQLAAIFQLLKDNKETFGEVSERDMEEQLRLYSI